MPLAQLAIYLESKVLEEVCGSIRLVGLCPAAGIDPHANGRGLCPWGVFGGNLDALTPQHNQEARISTVNPLERVVDWVVDGSDTGEAKPRFTG